VFKHFVLVLQITKILQFSKNRSRKVSRHFHFSYYGICVNSRNIPTIYTEFEKAVFSLLCILQGSMKRDEYKLHMCMRRCYIKIKNRKLHFNTRRLYFILFLYINSNITNILFKNVCTSNNKRNYFHTKQLLSHCIIDTKNSALSGWVLLGLYFYLTKRYNAAIHVLEYVKSLVSLGQFPVNSHSHIPIRDMLSNTNREYGFINIFQKMKLKTARVIMLSPFTEDQSFTITDELLQRFPGNRVIMCPPGVLLYYLRFISYHRLNDISRRQDCLLDLMLYVKKLYPKCGPWLQLSSLCYLRRAFINISDPQSAINCAIMINTLLESTDLKKILDQE